MEYARIQNPLAVENAEAIFVECKHHGAEDRCGETTPGTRYI